MTGPSLSVSLSFCVDFVGLQWSWELSSRLDYVHHKLLEIGCRTTRVWPWSLLTGWVGGGMSSAQQRYVVGV